MTDTMLDKYLRRSQNAAADGPRHEPEVGANPNADPDAADDLGCFGWLRGVRERALMLELRKKDGHVLAVGYAWLERVEYNPDHGITLHLPGQKIHITGTSLNTEIRPDVRLFDGIIRHRVPWIQEYDLAAFISHSCNKPIIESITWNG